MRRKLIAGNWKMNGSLAANAALLQGIRTGLKASPKEGAKDPACDIAVCVPAAYLAPCQSLLTDSGIVLGARVPTILTSRADSAATRLTSCAVAVLLHYAAHPELKV